MASPAVAVAKASFAATLLRHDPSPRARQNAEDFQHLLDSTIVQCSRLNVQKCKQWVLANLVRSQPCLAALAKYLAALSGSFKDSPSGDSGSGSKNKKNPFEASSLSSAKRERVPSARRRRIHVLYILNDIFYHTKFPDQIPDFIAAMEGVLVQLVKSAAAYPNCPKHVKKIQDLIALWEEKQYFDPVFLDKLRTTAKEAPESAEDVKMEETLSEPSKLARDAPWVLPSMHGDPTIAWQDLPASTWLPVLEPNSTRPMNPSMIKPIQMSGGLADSHLVDAVKDVMAYADRLFNQEGSRVDENVTLNELGERVEVDEITSEIINGETYYGWSRRFSEKMKERRRKDKDGRRSRSRARSESMARSRSSSRPALKRRRLSASRSRSGSGERGRGRSRSRSGSRGRRRSYSRSPSGSTSRSRSTSHHRRRSYSRSGSRSLSRSRSRSRKHRRSPSHSGSPSRDRSRSYKRRERSYDDREPGRDGRRGSQAPGPYLGSSGLPPPPPPPGGPYPGHVPPPPPTGPGGQFQPSMPMPFFSGQQGFQNFPVPPPPPPNFQGQWPPPPPPPPGMPGMPQQGQGGWFAPTPVGMGNQGGHSGAGGAGGGGNGGWGPHQGDNMLYRGGGSGGGYRGRGGGRGGYRGGRGW